MVRSERRAGDGWVSCGCGDRHWGRFGAAGLLVEREGTVLLQHRAGFSHFGGSWGLPGGARDVGESALEAGARETWEETAIAPTQVRPVRAWRLTHPDWTYTTILARAIEPVHPVISDPESASLSFVAAHAVDAFPLHPGFASAWPLLRAGLDETWYLVVDVANVVGARPDGWWRDRLAAAGRLREHLAHLAAVGLLEDDSTTPGTEVRPYRLWPRITMVTEARAANLESVPGVRVVGSPGIGDDTVVAEVERVAVRPGARVLVATADRELADRVRRLGAETISPRRLWRAMIGS